MLMAIPLSRRQLLQLSGAAGLLCTLPKAAFAGEKSPAPAPSPYASFHPFTIGDIPALALNDGFGAMPLKPLWAPEASEEELKTALAREHLPTSSVAMQFNILLLKIGGETVLIDTGYGKNGGPTNGLLLDSLAKAGIQPSDITGIVLSHAHGDHFGGLVDAHTRALNFPNAKIFANKTEVDFWTGSASDSLGETKKSAATVLGEVKAKLEFVAPGDKILGGLELLDAHGHTPGHLAVLISSGSDQLLHIVDTAHNHVINFANPGWTVGFDTDNKQAAATRKKIFDRIVADRLRTFAYHLPWPGLGHIVHEGAGFRWLPEPWKWDS